MNYYTSAYSTIELPAPGFAPGAQFSLQVQATSYNGTAQIGYDVYFRRPLPDEQSCFHWSGITPSGSPLQQLTGAFPPPPQGVEWAGVSNATGCLDFTRVILGVRDFDYPGTRHVEWTFTLTYVPTSLPGGYCQYGTQLKPNSPVTLILDPNTLQLVFAELGAGNVALAFFDLLYSFVDVNALCGEGLPGVINIDLSTWQQSLESHWQVFKWAAWYLYCECKPGETATNPPPTPVLVVDPNWPQPPAFPCDPAQLCTAIVAIRQELATVHQTLNANYSLTTLMQRYRLPMAVIRGAKHSNLSGSGGIGLSRVIGIEYTITAQSERPVLPGNPGYHWDLGWMSVSDGQDMIQEKRITRVQELWLPELGPLADRFGYYLTPGTTMDVVELYAEP